MQQHDDHLESAREAMWSLPASERNAMLLISIAEQESGAVKFLHKLVSLIDHLATGLSPLRRWQLSELLRDCADAIEFPDRGEREYRFPN